MVPFAVEPRGYQCGGDLLGPESAWGGSQRYNFYRNPGAECEEMDRNGGSINGDIPKWMVYNIYNGKSIYDNG